MRARPRLLRALRPLRGADDAPDRVTALFALGLHHRRLISHCLVADQEHGTDNSVVELEQALELGAHFVRALGVQEHVMRLVNLVDGVCKLAAAPVFEAMDGTTVFLDQALVPLHHGGHLLTLVRMDQIRSRSDAWSTPYGLKPPLLRREARSPLAGPPGGTLQKGARSLRTYKNTHKQLFARRFNCSRAAVRPRKGQCRP